jgi:hypothetical protein
LLLTNISEIITNLYPNSQQVLSSKFQAGIESYLADSSQLPIIILDNELPKTAEIHKNNNVIKDTKVLISILDLDDTNNTDEQSQLIVDKCEEIADRIAVQIYQIIAVRPQPSQKYKITPMFHVFTSNLTGVALEMQVNYNEIVNFAPAIPVSVDNTNLTTDNG